MPHIFLYKLNKTVLQVEVQGWADKYHINKSNSYIAFINLMIFIKEFRSVFYYRCGYFSRRLLEWYMPGTVNLFILGEIASPLFIIHGHSTYIHAQRIGEGCQIWHNVTIGKKLQGKDQLQPIIGNNVKISTGAIVIGNITIGDNSTIGAGSVVIKDVPANCVVAGNPAKIISQLNH